MLPTEIEGFTFENSSLFTSFFSLENKRKLYISVVSGNKCGKFTLGKKSLHFSSVG